MAAVFSGASVTLIKRFVKFSFVVLFSPNSVGRGYDLADQVATTDLSVIAESIPICNTLPLKNREGVGKAIALPYSGESLSMER
jgi:hypothetical protein